MAGKAVTNSGTTIHMTPTPLADGVMDLTAWEALTGWVKIAGVTNAGPFGPSYQEVTSDPLDETGGTYKGGRRDGSVTLDVELRDGDEGQGILLGAALASFENYGFKVELNNKPAGAGSKPTRRFFPAKVMGAPVNPGGKNNLVTQQVTLGIDGAAGGVVNGPRTVVTP